MELAILVFGYVVPIGAFGIIIAIMERNARRFSDSPEFA